MSYYDTFGLPVIETSPDLKEAYLNVIAKPMCLTDLEKNYQTKLYTTFEEFQIDLKLIWDNCKLFNEPGSAVYKKAKNLQSFTTKFFNKHLKQVDKTECTTVDVALKMKRHRNDDEEEGGGYGVKTRSRSKNENKVETSSAVVVDVEEVVKVEEDEESKKENKSESKKESKETNEHNEHNEHEEEVKMKKIEKEKEKYVDKRKSNAIVMNNRCNNVTTVKRKNYVPLPLKMFNRKKSSLVMNGKVVTHINKMHFQRGVIERQQQHKQKVIKDEVKKPQKIIDDDSDNENNNNSKNNNNNNNNIHPITKDNNKESTPLQQQQPTQTKSSPSPIISPSQPEPSPLITPLALPPPQLPLPPPSLPSPPQDQPLIPTKPKYIDEKEKLQLSVLISRLSEDGLLNFLVKVDGLSQDLIGVYNDEQIYFKVERISKDIYPTIFSDLSEILQAERDAQKVITLGTFK